MMPFICRLGKCEPLRQPPCTQMPLPSLPQDLCASDIHCDQAHKPRLLVCSTFVPPKLRTWHAGPVQRERVRESRLLNGLRQGPLQNQARGSQLGSLYYLISILNPPASPSLGSRRSHCRRRPRRHGVRCHRRRRVNSGEGFITSVEVDVLVVCEATLVSVSTGGDGVDRAEPKERRARRLLSPSGNSGAVADAHLPSSRARPSNNW